MHGELRLKKVFIVFIYFKTRLYNADHRIVNCHRQNRIHLRLIYYPSYCKTPNNKFRAFYLKELHPKLYGLPTTLLYVEAVFLLRKHTQTQRILHVFIDYRAWLTGDTVHPEHIGISLCLQGTLCCFTAAATCTAGAEDVRCVCFEYRLLQAT
jgi:hypothetical protein